MRSSTFDGFDLLAIENGSPGRVFPSFVLPLLQAQAHLHIRLDIVSSYENFNFLRSMIAHSWGEFEYQEKTPHAQRPAHAPELP